MRSPVLLDPGSPPSTYIHPESLRDHHGNSRFRYEHIRGGAIRNCCRSLLLSDQSHKIHSLEYPNTPVGNGVILFIGTLTGIGPTLLDCMLLIRLHAVYSARRVSRRHLLIIMAIPIVLNIGRLANSIYFVATIGIQMRRLVKGNTGVDGGDVIETTKLPSVKIEWVMQIFDDWSVFCPNPHILFSKWKIPVTHPYSSCTRCISQERSRRQVSAIQALVLLTSSQAGSSRILRLKEGLHTVLDLRHELYLPSHSQYRSTCHLSYPSRAIRHFALYSRGQLPPHDHFRCVRHRLGFRRALGAQERRRDLIWRARLRHPL